MFASPSFKNNKKKDMTTAQEIKAATRIRTKGFDISIGKRIDQIGLISQSTDEFTPFDAIRKGGRLSKIKRKFRSKLSSSTHFFFEGFSKEDILQLIKMLK
jgi:hypothetical protein